MQSPTSASGLSPGADLPCPIGRLHQGSWDPDPSLAEPTAGWFRTAPKYGLHRSLLLARVQGIVRSEIERIAMTMDDLPPAAFAPEDRCHPEREAVRWRTAGPGHRSFDRHQVGKITADLSSPHLVRAG